MKKQIKEFFTRILVTMLILVLSIIINDELVGYILLTLALILFLSRIIKSSERKEYT